VRPKFLTKKCLRDLLTGGTRRSIGHSDAVADLVCQEPVRFPELIECLWDEDALVRMRAADAAEKASREKPDMLQPHKRELLGLLSEAVQQELRWHLAAMIPRLQLTGAERRRAVECLELFLEDRSSIVKTFAMQGLADLARRDPGLRVDVIERIRKLTRTGTPAMRARGCKLLRELEKS
jgi:hypothetical protein